MHRIVWTGGRYAHASATPEGFADRIWIVIDLADPEHPVEAARWRLDEHAARPAKRYAAHHALFDGDVAYLGYGDAGMVVLDVADSRGRGSSRRLEWGGGDTHTCLPLPGRELVVVTDEQVVDGEAEPRLVRVVDVADPAAPRVVGVCPQPERRSRRFASGRTTCTRTGPGATAASGSSSPPTSAAGSSSTTSRPGATARCRALAAGGAAGQAGAADERPLRRRRRARLAHRPGRRRPGRARA